MNTCSLSALFAFGLFGMGLTAFIFGFISKMDNRKSKKSHQMFLICICVFFWNFGYAWMSLCHNDSFAYIPRAIALLSIVFYMAFTVNYIRLLTNFPLKPFLIFTVLFIISSMIAWWNIIQKDAVTFTMVPWGYWYYSKMSPARVIQFTSNMACIIFYYIILYYGTSHATLKRDIHVYTRFHLFGPILVLGYAFDTLFPILFKTPAVPGSCVGAFFSAIILFHISKQNKVFGLTEANVSHYVFEDVHLPVIITDSSDNIVMFNKFAPNYLGCDAKKLIGQKLNAILSVDNTDIACTLHSNREYKINQNSINDRFGDLLYTIYFLHDVTMERQTLRMLETTRELAEEANRAKSNFLANMSHEIRTPMNAIIGMSEIILQDSGVPQNTLTQVNEIHIASQNLLDIINDILDISKIEAGKFELISDRYDLPSLIHDVSNIIRTRLQESNVSFIIRLDETLPKDMIGDVGKIRQILLNILGNAVKFVPKGSITFSVSWNGDVSEPQLFFDVIDTGIGIKPENLDKIFGEFSQIDTRKNRNIQGTGLGLAISKHLAELMGGTVTVESVYGKGSTFHIVIRQKIVTYLAIGTTLKNELETGNFRSALRKQSNDIVPRPNAHILIVDDTRVNLIVARGLMQKYQMKIDTAQNGMEAIEKIRQTDYDLVFMDHMMPEMDGVETTKAIRALGGKYEELPIIALTANALKEAKDMFLKEGMQDFLAKPISAKALDQIINRWL